MEKMMLSWIWEVSYIVYTLYCIGVDLLLQNTPTITTEKQTLQPENAFEYIVFRAVPFEIVKI
jgi:hypothetical protein